MKFTSFQKATFVGRDKSQIFAPFCVDVLPNTRKLHVCVKSKHGLIFLNIILPLARENIFV